MSRGAPPWAMVNLRVSCGDVPPVGTELRMRSGRRYQVIDVRGRGLSCLVLPPEAETQGAVWDWQWTPRKPSKRRPAQ
jgi:hypothetical protein